MTKKVLYLVFAGMLVMGMAACGKEADTDIPATTKTEIVSTEEETAATEEEKAGTQETETEENKSTQNDAEKEEEIQKEEAGVQALTSEDAEKLLLQTLGEKDKETGNTYSFGYVDTITVDGTEYHMFVWSWLVEDHSSRITDLFVAVDGSAIYEGLYKGETAEVFKEKNYLKD